MNTVLFSSKSDEWETPDDVFRDLDMEFNFNLDPCASEENKKCNQFFSLEQNGLNQNWGGQSVFCNPPYSQIYNWVEKCYTESLKPNTVVVMLIPSRTDTRYFHDFINHRSEIRFIRGRLRFGHSKNSAPFPSMVVIFRSAKYRRARNDGQGSD